MPSFLRHTGIIAFLSLTLLPGETPAQALTNEEITFFSADGVELEGTYYPGTRGSKSPCALLLHRTGGSRRDEGMGPLAVDLQRAGFAVLSFDFRGHGGSVNVQRDFWLHAAHKSLRGFHPARTQVSHEDFTTSYHLATLVNDITAARHVFDLRAQARECDPSRTIVIGVDTGATLGALWVASEWERPRTVRGPGGKVVRLGTEGHDIAGAVWLGISPTLAGRSVPVEDWLAGTVRERVPMALLYSRENAREAKVNEGLFGVLQKAGADRVHRFTSIRGIGDTDASAATLLASADTRNMVNNYLRNVIKSARAMVRPRSDLGAPPLVPLEQFGIR